MTSSVLFTGSWLVGGSSNLGGWLLRSNFSDDELVELTELIDLNDAAKEKDVPDSVSYTHLTLPTILRV